MASLVSLPRQSSLIITTKACQPWDSQSVKFRALQSGFCAGDGLHSSKVNWPVSGGLSTMVPLLAGPSRSMQTGAVSGYPDILQPDESSRQPTLVGGSRGKAEQTKWAAASTVQALHGEVEIEFQDSTGWIKCQRKYPSHGLRKQQNGSGQLNYLVLFLSPAQRSTSWSFSI